MSPFRVPAGLIFSGLILAASSARADVIELANGDVLNGKVVSLDEKVLVLKSDLLGDLKLDREKVSAIHLGDNAKLPPKPAAGPPPSAVPNPNPLAADPEVQRVLNSVPSTDDVIKQLQGGGVNPQMIGAIQTKFPLLNTPEASGYFNDTVTGLMTGRLNIGDIRKDAVKARDELKDLQDELGPDGAALNGYMSILNNFINETAPPKTEKKAAPKSPMVKPKPKTPATFPPKD